MTPPDSARGDIDPPQGDIELEGRILQASNATFVGAIDGVKVVYKPVAGERPLWDFPAGSLARRERAAFLLSETLGWDVVPPTWLRDGPFGPGMVQLWRQPDPEQEAVTLVPTEELPVPGWCHIFDGVDGQDRAVSLIHEDSAALRTMAIFDALANNADRKGGHVLEMPGGHRYGVDHGLTFHAEYKLRTVLWGWQDEELSDGERAGVARVHEALSGDLGEALAALLSEVEIGALLSRCEVLLADAVFPSPRQGEPTIPWPPF